MKSDVRVSIIAGMAKNRVIGQQNQLPWYCPEDLRWFREKTLHKPVIMGRKTFESIGQALDERLNIVITRDNDFKGDNIWIMSRFFDALDYAKLFARQTDQDEIFIIGGSTFFKKAVPLAHRMYITHFDVEADGDAHFPPFDPNQWGITYDQPGQETDVDLDYRFTIYDRI